MTETLDRKACLDAAAKCVLGQRQEDYGTLEDNFGAIASLWTTYLEGATGTRPQIKPADVAVMMALLKIARLMGNPRHADSYIDACGYMACGAEIATGGKA